MLKIFSIGFCILIQNIYILVSSLLRFQTKQAATGVAIQAQPLADSAILFVHYTTEDETMVVIRKVSPEQWAYEINRAAHLRTVQKHKARQLKFRYYDTFLSRLMPLPFVIGMTAIILIIHFYGWQDLGKLALSWLVSVTIISTLVYHMFKRFEAELG